MSQPSVYALVPDPPRGAGTGSISGVAIGAGYTDEEREFLLAVDLYKRRHRRPFPAWTELLAVVKALGYRRPGFDEEGRRVE